MKEKKYNIFRYIILTILSISTLFPIYWLMATSLKSERDIFASPPVFKFKPLYDSYNYILESGFIHTYLLNSVIVTVFTVCFTLIIGSLCAYSLVRLRFKGNKMLAITILAFQMLPGVVIVVPLFIIMKNFGLINTKTSLIITYVAYNLPFAVWLLSSYFSSIPMAIEEAALIDGANRFQIYWKIILPLSLPGLLATAVFVFIFAWNEFLFAVNLTATPEAQTMPVAVTSFIQARGVAYDRLSAAAFIMLIPGIFFGIFARKYLVKGLTAGSVK